MLRKKLLQTICTPRVREKTDGMTMRSICSASKLPKPSLAQPETAKTDPHIPSTTNTPPAARPVSSVMWWKARFRRGQQTLGDGEDFGEYGKGAKLKAEKNRNERIQKRMHVESDAVNDPRSRQ